MGSMPKNRVQKEQYQIESELRDQRYLRLLGLIDLTKAYYYSHTYPLMYTVQHRFASSQKRDEACEVFNLCLRIYPEI